jgi:exonuclease SbcD
VGIEDHWLSVVLTDAVRPRDAMERLRSRFPARPAPLVRARGPLPSRSSSYAARLRDRGDLEVAGDFVEHVRGQAATREEIALLADALAGWRLDEASV